MIFVNDGLDLHFKGQLKLHFCFKIGWETFFVAGHDAIILVQILLKLVQG